MRILHVIYSLAKGGAERYALDVCNELSSRPGFEVMLVTLSPENAFEFEKLHFKHVVTSSTIIPSITRKSVVNTADFERIVKDFNPQIIHSHLFRGELMAHEVYFPGVKYVTHCQDNMEELYNFSFSKIFQKRSYTRLFEKNWIIKRYRKCKNNFIVISRDSEKFYKKVLPKDLQRIFLLHHAINFNKFNASNRIRTIIPAKVNLVYTARFAVYKNHTFLVDVIEVLKKRGLDVSCIMLGGGTLFTEVKSKAEQMGLLKEISFPGFVDDVGRYLSDADVYVHPAYYEPFGLVLVEAMAAGLPVVCLDGKGNRDLIVDGKNGFMVFEQNPELFADKIMEVIRSQEKYNQLAAGAVSFAKDFDIKNHTDKLINYYNSL